jgi:hypothetical protein
MGATSSFSIELLTTWMDQLDSTDKFMALFSADPLAVSDPSSVEIIGVTYARQDSTWNRVSPTRLTLAAAVVWRSLPPGAVVAAVGGFNDAFAATGFLFRDMLPTPITYPSGGSYVLPAGEYDLGFDLAP